MDAAAVPLAPGSGDVDDLARAADRSARWVNLSEFITNVSAARSERDAMRVAVERAAASFVGAVAAIVDRDGVVESCGVPDVVPVDGLPALLEGVDAAHSLEIPGIGECHALVARVAARPHAVLLVARPAEPFTRKDVVLLRSMGRALSLTLGLVSALEEERALRESLQERQALLERLARIQRSIVHRAPLQEVLQAICEGAAALTGDEVVGLRLVDPDDPDRLVLVADVGVPDDVRAAIARQKLSEGVGGRAVLEERLVVADDYSRTEFALPAFQKTGLGAAMAAPVIEGRRVVGSLTVATYARNRRYSQAEQEALLAFAEHASLALNDARTVDALHSTLRDALHSATHDPLTGLPNRSILFEHLEEVLSARRGDDGIAVLFIDLDRFKAVNDSLGHDIGDRVLVAVARRLRSAVRPVDLVARLAGDEFVVVCSGLHGEVDAIGLADRISHEVSSPIALPGRDVIVTASIGIAQTGDADLTADQLLRDADMAMYRAKERGSDRIEVFGGSLRSAVRARLDLEHALRQAIMREEFRIVYQPVVDLSDGRPQSLEALVRWEHAGRLISPADFIPVAEETGLIVPIGGWVLREACEQVAHWRRISPLLAGIGVAVNVSMRQFADEAFVGVVAETLDATGLEPAALSLEVTESMLLDDVDHGIRTLRDLKDLGVRLAIDDFGTGYSSLAYLRRFPVDILKIDRSFVEHLGSEPEEGAVLAAIVALGNALGLGVVAEGVETGLQVDELRRLGIEGAQGYYFARPARADEARPWVERALSVELAAARAG
ncbi:MAG TPA: EAL domain-containing protein [Acidimicrobiales bacterium]|nr:EAL domain-containing protein [Acidimicrobiales bacterium]